MSDTTADIVMKFVYKDNSPVLSESTLDALDSDEMMKDFKPITDYNDYSNFFEVTSFNFTAALRPRDQGVGAFNQQQAATGRAPAATDQFFLWRSAGDPEYKSITFPSVIDSFSFTRVIDGASPIFFGACCNQVSFRSAALVRRFGSGLGGGAQRQSAGFLRMDFKDVLLISVNWSDGALVTESCTFICKAMRLRYRQQNPDSSLLPSIEAFWNPNGQISSKSETW